MKYLIREDILLINKNTISRHGGFFIPPSNFKNEGALDFLLEAVQSKMFGEEMYPTISDKAGLYIYNVNGNHIFQDGNKRTGLEAALLFLKLNGYKLKKELNKIEINDKVVPKSGGNRSDILEEFTLEVASSKLILKETQQWFKENVKEL